MARIYFYISLLLFLAPNFLGAKDIAYKKFALVHAETNNNQALVASKTVNNFNGLISQHINTPNDYFDEAFEDVTDESDDNEECFRKSLNSSNHSFHAIFLLTDNGNSLAAAKHFFSFSLNVTYISKYLLFCNYRI